MTETLGAATGRATKTAKGTTDTAKGAANGTPLSDLAHSPAVDHLKEEAREFLAAQAQRMLVGLGRKLGETTGKLNDIADGNSPGFAKLALEGGRKIAEGKGPLRTALEVGAGRAKDNVLGALKNLGGGKGGRGGGAGNKPTVILESIDVGVPVRTAYDRWTRYQDFSTFAKGVKSAGRADDTHSDWQLKVFWSNRSWKAHTTEQVPDDRITWTSEGAKGTTKGTVSFHALADNLTRVLLVIEYYPKGLFEKTGNLWRAQGRRARLDLKHFARFVTLKGEAEEGWRGEIRDGEVVRSHEDVVADEEREESRDDDEARDEHEDAEDAYEDDEGAYDDEEPDDEPRDADEETDEGEYADDEDAEDAYEEDPEAPDEAEDAYEDDAEEDSDEEPYDYEDEEQGAVGGSRR
ncbi:SRPBCC family protein [Streptomyces neyagawaensis]|uniref:SRPBCC family protein n=1 Tax=Streptomyces neyagawaensis TaxID=42238 RepID=UPI0006E1FEA2|nr:SRPBCC family protein [Streptomyces neyagawaensis]MCL6732044.1 cyclase [Streptomyces neyagawaensis]MDE1682462.1 SRPBCC family protein [Streptomyces neyagawaensis]